MKPTLVDSVRGPCKNRSIWKRAVCFNRRPDTDADCFAIHRLHAKALEIDGGTLI